MTQVTLTIGPDDQCSGIAWISTILYDGTFPDHLDNGGWKGKGPRRSSSTDAWEALAKRKIGLPGPVKKAGLKWSDAVVVPKGYSQGCGHAPQGIKITWSW